MTEASWLVFVVASLVLIATPGRDMIRVMSRSVAQGTAAGGVSSWLRSRPGVLTSVLSVVGRDPGRPGCKTDVRAAPMSADAAINRTRRFLPFASRTARPATCEPRH